MHDEKPINGYGTSSQSYLFCSMIDVSALIPLKARKWEASSPPETSQRDPFRP